MADHDPLCPQGPPDNPWCMCALIARVRADERRRELLAVCECGCRERDAHAEAVAATLVEVICQQEGALRNAIWELGTVHDMHDAARIKVRALVRICKKVLEEADTLNDYYRRRLDDGIAAKLVEVIVAQEAEINACTHMLSACRDERVIEERGDA